eukprot:CAMPEP_0119503810 /NCGR_PEP_ID=MMETSP1344-20130328/24865_1 /TAXON_ID=236787 /ORGANISM="Florenciella parvula, Strain CCMP2471" /LENGTH=168 /DNA_ID=CAMNT_0007540135 /DNA_START=18 /DNA_END=521 /DNA_ORIENTATION=+
MEGAGVQNWWIFNFLNKRVSHQFRDKGWVKRLRRRGRTNGLWVTDPKQDFVHDFPQFDTHSHPDDGDADGGDGGDGGNDRGGGDDGAGDGAVGRASPLTLTDHREEHEEHVRRDSSSGQDATLVMVKNFETMKKQIEDAKNFVSQIIEFFSGIYAMIENFFGIFTEGR